MKKLSIEQKAKRYDEILVKLQEAKVDNNVCDDRYCCVIEDIVPELTELEDEMVRKELYAVVNDLVLPNEQKARFNAWLEKQGEQKDILEDATIDNNEDGLIADTIKAKGKQKPWSEDDEAILSWCISDIERAKYCRSQTKPELCDIEINWLKSRVGCELKRATTCRPSEEEMKALEFCIEHNIDKDGVFGSKVVKLYEKLKKLMEE